VVKLFIGVVALATAWLVSSEGAARDFQPCADAKDFPGLAGSLCTVTSVPLQPSASDTESQTVALFVRKFLAEGHRQPRGQLWLVAGGPGESGASLYPLLPTLRRAFPAYDLVIPDHRGTGYSSKLCAEQESPESPDGIALAGEEWGPCVGALHSNVARTQAFTITNAARDLSALITRHRAGGEVQVYAVSYGTQLALRMLLAAPVTIDGLILDGLVPPESAAQWDLSHRTAVVDAVGRQLLTPQQTQNYRALLNTPQSPELASLSGGDLHRTMGSLLAWPAVRDRIPQLLEALAKHDFAPLAVAIADVRRLSAGLALYPQSPPSLPLVSLISGSENNARPDLTRAVVAEEANDALFTSTIPGLLVNSPIPLYSRDGYFGQTPPWLPRTLIIHGTLDPNTPYEGARAHAALLAAAGDVHVTTVDRGAHFLALIAPHCFIGAASAFVQHARLPERCAEGSAP